VTNDDGTVSAESGSTLDIEKATIVGGAVDIAGTLDAAGIDVIDAADIDIASTGVVDATLGAVLTINCAGADVESPITARWKPRAASSISSARRSPIPASCKRSTAAP